MQAIGPAPDSLRPPWTAENAFGDERQCLYTAEHPRASSGLPACTYTEGVRVHAGDCPPGERFCQACDPSS